MVLLTLTILLSSFLFAANFSNAEKNIPSENHSGNHRNFDPADVIEQFHGLLLTSMKQNDDAQRRALMTEAVSRFFRTGTIARISLGRHWRALSAEQKTSFTHLLDELISTTYAARFDQYNGQIFNTGAIEDLGKDRVRVKTTLTTRLETVSLEYQLQRQDDDWRIYDIVANGVSDLSLKRSNYSALFDKGGLEAVETEIRSSLLEHQTGHK